MQRNTWALEISSISDKRALKKQRHLPKRCGECRVSNIRRHGIIVYDKHPKRRSYKNIRGLRLKYDDISSLLNDLTLADEELKESALFQCVARLSL